MILWRISRHADLSGTGGLQTPGRWHHLGHPVVYLASNPAAALLEVCVHTSANDVPPSFTLLEVFVPESLVVERINLDSLPSEWISAINITRDLGTAWLDRRQSPLLKVPSAVVPETVNFLLNPLHPDSIRCKIASTRSYPFDPRLKR